MEFKQLDILLVNSSSELGELIADMQGNRFHHAGLIVRAYGSWYVVEAIETGVGYTPIEEYMSRDDVELIVLRLKDGLLDVDAGIINSFILPFTRTGYDYGNLLILQPIRFIIKKVFGIDTKIGRRKVKAEKRFICSEWAAFVYNHFNNEIFEDWNELVPVDLYDNKNFKHIKLKEKKV